MATQVQELFHGRQGSMDATRQGRYTRAFRVTFDSKAPGPIAAMEAVSIAIGSSYTHGSGADLETDLGSFCKALNAVCDTDDGRGWTVTASYEPGEVSANEDPLAQPAQISWDMVPTEEIADIDRNGDPIVNSAGDPFDPPVMRDRLRPVLKVVANFATYDPAAAMQYANSISSTTLEGAGIGTAKIGSLRATRNKSQFASTVDKLYWTYEIEIHFHEATWKKRILDQGTRQVVSGAYRPIMSNGAPVTTPVLLNGSGAPLAPAGTPTYLEFEIYTPESYAWIQSAIDRP